MGLNIKKDFGTGRKPKPELTSLMYGLLPPQANELEDAIIGALINEGRKMETVLEIIPNPDYFYQDSHRKIYAAMDRLIVSGNNIDLLTIGDELRKTGELEMVGGPYRLMQLSNDVTSGAHINDHARIVSEKYMAREAIRIAGEVISAGYDDSTNVFEMIDNATLEFGAITAFASGDTTEHIRGSVIKAKEQMEAMATRKVALTGIDTGLRDLNAITNGWQDEDLIIIAARPSQGKTAIALHFAISALISELSNTNGGVFIASLEMSKLQLTQRIISYVSGIDMGIIKNGSYTPEQKVIIDDATNKVSAMEIHIEDKAGLTVKQIEVRAKKVQRKLEKKGKKLLLVITDYLQLTTVVDARKKLPEQQISESSAAAKVLAKNLHCPHIMLAQMNRAIESAKRKPNLSDLRGSGAIEQDADVVIFINHETDPNTHVTKNMLIISKHRNGRTDDIEVKFYGANQKWMNKEDQEFKSMKTYAPPLRFDEDKKIIEEDGPF